MLHYASFVRCAKKGVLLRMVETEKASSLLTSISDLKRTIIYSPVQSPPTSCPNYHCTTTFALIKLFAWLPHTVTLSCVVVSRAIAT